MLWKKDNFPIDFLSSVERRVTLLENSQKSKFADSLIDNELEEVKVNRIQAQLNALYEHLGLELKYNSGIHFDKKTK